MTEQKQEGQTYWLFECLRKTQMPTHPDAKHSAGVIVGILHSRSCTRIHMLSGDGRHGCFSGLRDVSCGLGGLDGLGGDLDGDLGGLDGLDGRRCSNPSQPKSWLF